MEINARSLLEIAREVVKTYPDSPFYAEIQKEQYDLTINSRSDLLINSELPGLPTIDVDLEGLDLDASLLQQEPQQKAKSRLEELTAIIAEKVHQENSLVLVDTNQFECFFYGIYDDDFMDTSLDPGWLATRIREKTKDALFWKESYFFNCPKSEVRAFLGVYTIESIHREAQNRWKKTNCCFRQEIDQHKNDPIYAELSEEYNKYYSATLILLRNLPSNFCTLPDSKLYLKLKEMAGCTKDESNYSNNGWDADGELIATKLGLEILGQGPATILTADKKLQEREKALIAVLKEAGKEYFYRKFYDELSKKTFLQKNIWE